jgi:beta-N-acetylhexosaminidase
VTQRTGEVAADEAKPVVVGTTGASGDDDQAQVVRELAASDVRLVVVALSNPYDLQVFPEVPCYLTTYGDGDAALAALDRVLRGEASAEGELPISMPSDSPEST